MPKFEIKKHNCAPSLQALINGMVRMHTLPNYESFVT